MPLAYAADALIYDAAQDSYALRPDFDPALHQVDIAFGESLGWPAGEAAGWNASGDPQIAQVRDMGGVPLHAGHAYVAERLCVTDPRGTDIWIDMLEIDHVGIGAAAGRPLQPGTAYRAAGAPVPTPAPAGGATGFAPGTRIATETGEVPVEWLRPGDRVRTFEGGARPLRWIGHARLGARALAHCPALRPARLTAGQGCLPRPAEALVLAPDTRLLVAGFDLAVHFALDRALVRAADVAPDSDRPGGSGAAAWIMLLFDAPELLRANGLWCESLVLEGADTALPGLQSAPPPPGIRHHRHALSCLQPWEARLFRTLGADASAGRRTTAA